MVYSFETPFKGSDDLWWNKGFEFKKKKRLRFFLIIFNRWLQWGNNYWLKKKNLNGSCNCNQREKKSTNRWFDNKLMWFGRRLIDYFYQGCYIGGRLFLGGSGMALALASIWLLRLVIIAWKMGKKDTVNLYIKQINCIISSLIIPLTVGKKWNPQGNSI